MSKKNQVRLLAAILAIVAVGVIVAALTQQFTSEPVQPAPRQPTPEDGAKPDEDGQAKHFCSPQSREAAACIQLYDPVCGWFDPEKIQCVRYPCAQTFSNSCFACMDEKVQYWTKGECKK
ncbi:hypothetical protein HYU18_00165 [Candidatus Woesearchaeota archaeon]|nr:hypothetical protein [Candidatus Woesearchaeota archaeon]